MAYGGYNPQVSLIPAVGGTINAMSGGGYGVGMSGGYGGVGMSGGYAFQPPSTHNIGTSLLQAEGGEIREYSGGFYEQHMNGGNEPLIVSNRNRRAAKFTALKGQESTPDVAIAPTAPTVPTVPIAPTAPTVSTDPIVPTTVPLVIPNTSKSDDKEKQIVLFGTPITFENPKIGQSDTITDNQIKALKLLGLDGDGLSKKEKIDVLQALYDGKCDTDGPVIFLQKCEPIRRIVQALALNLLKQLNPINASNVTNIKNEDKPTVEYTEIDGAMKICLTFKKGQLSLLSKINTGKKTNKKSAAATTSGTTDSASGTTDVTSGTTDVTSGTTDTASGTTDVTSDTTDTASGTTDSASGTTDITSGTTTDTDTTPIVTNSDLITTLGIDNPNMWCYATSGIQFLFSIPQLRQAILKYDCDKSFQLPADITAIDNLTQDKINNSGILCALQLAFKELDKSTTKFTKENWEKDFTKATIDNNSVAYLMKGYLYTRSPTTVKIDNNQQDVDEFIKYLLEIVDNDTNLKSSLNTIRWKRTSTYKCENSKYTKEDRPNPESELTVQLILQEFINENNSSYINKITKAKATNIISLQDLINHFSKPAKLDGDIEGCGPDNTKGPGTKADIIKPTVGNNFLIFQINKGSSPHKASQISNKYSINAESTVTIDKDEKIKYNIYGAILYGGSGESGHYMFERLYYPLDKTELELDKLPFIMYNSGKVTPNDNQSYTIAENAFYIIYKKVSGTGSDAITGDAITSDAITDDTITDNRTPYEILGIEKEGLTRSILKRAYKKKALETHPNKGGDTEEFKKLQNAYETLMKIFNSNQPQEDKQTSNLPQLTDETFRESVNKILKDSEIPLILDRDYNNLPKVIELLRSDSILLKLNETTKAQITKLLPILKGYKEALDEKKVPQFLAIMNKNERKILNSEPLAIMNPSDIYNNSSSAIDIVQNKTDNTDKLIPVTSQLTDKTFIIKVNEILGELNLKKQLTSEMNSLSSILKNISSPAMKLKFRANGISVNEKTREKFNIYQNLLKILKDYKKAREEDNVDNFLKLMNKNEIKFLNNVYKPTKQNLETRKTQSEFITGFAKYYQLYKNTKEKEKEMGLENDDDTHSITNSPTVNKKINKTISNKKVAQRYLKGLDKQKENSIKVTNRLSKKHRNVPPINISGLFKNEAPNLVKSPKTLTSDNIKNYRNKTTLGVSTGPQLTKRQREMRNRGVFGGKRTRKTIKKYRK